MGGFYFWRKPNETKTLNKDSQVWVGALHRRFGESAIRLAMTAWGDFMIRLVITSDFYKSPYNHLKPRLCFHA